VIGHNDNEQGTVLPSSIVRDAISVFSLAWAMFRAYTASAVLYFHLKRKLRKTK
jgi:hypothetical protein